jgi:hypothetical protein
MIVYIAKRLIVVVPKVTAKSPFRMGAAHFVGCHFPFKRVQRWPGQLSCAPKIHKTTRHSAMTTAAVL